MQISIDASTSTPTALRLTADILTFIAAYKENSQKSGLTTTNSTPTPAAEPVAPIASPAPPATSAASESPAPQIEVLMLDAANEAWSPELHTANQSKNTDGTWRRKRTQKGEAPQVVELPKALQVPHPPIAVLNSVGTDTAVPSALTDLHATVLVVPPAPPVPTDPSPTQGVATFAALVKYATTLIGTKKITTAQLLEACAEGGVSDIHACSLPQNLALIPGVAAAIQKRSA